jgi:hypothetical protein
MEDQKFALSDRDFIIALFDALGALAYELTGKTLFVSITPEGGNPISVYPNTARAHLVSSPAGPVGFPYVRQEQLKVPDVQQ